MGTVHPNQKIREDPRRWLASKSKYYLIIFTKLIRPLFAKFIMWKAPLTGGTLVKTLAPFDLIRRLAICTTPESAGLRSFGSCSPRWSWDYMEIRKSPPDSAWCRTP